MKISKIIRLVLISLSLGLSGAMSLNSTQNKAYASSINYFSKSKLNLNIEQQLLNNKKFETGNSPWEKAEGKDLIQQTSGDDNEITYQNNATGKYYQAFEQAVKNWNSLGVIKLVPTNENPEITMASDDNDFKHLSKDTLGITNYTSTSGSNIITNAKSSISPSRNAKASEIELISTATHEVGHSLGFAHDHSVTKCYWNKKPFEAQHMMSPYSDISLIIPVGLKEENALKQHYLNQTNDVQDSDNNGFSVKKYTQVVKNKVRLNQQQINQINKHY